MEKEKEWWEESPKEFTDGFTETTGIHPIGQPVADPDPEIIAGRYRFMFEQRQGGILRIMHESGLTLDCTASEAYALLDLLYQHHEALYQLSKKS